MTNELYGSHDERRRVTARMVIDMRGSHFAEEAAELALEHRMPILFLYDVSSQKHRLFNRMKKQYRSHGLSRRLVQCKELPAGPHASRNTIRNIVLSGDVLVTDSCLLANEVLRRGGYALNSCGIEFLVPEMQKRVYRYWYHFYLREYGYGGFPQRQQFTEETKRSFLSKLTRLAEEQVAYRGLPEESEPRASSPTIFIDADSCPFASEIAACAYVVSAPAVYVCADSADGMCGRVESSTAARMALEAGLLEFIEVRAGKNSADNTIVELLEPNDVVVTLDIGLTRRALQSGSIVVDYDGRVIHPERGSDEGLKGSPRRSSIRSKTAHAKAASVFIASLEETMREAQNRERQIRLSTRGVYR